MPCVIRLRGGAPEAIDGRSAAALAGARTCGRPLGAWAGRSTSATSMRVLHGCDWEIAAPLNPIHDVQRLGIDFVASPRHADLLW